MATLTYVIKTAAEKTMTIAQSPTASSFPAAGQRSPWHSPVPYLFGGLAAMLGLIAFALLILACSYWRLSGFLENNGERDLEAGDQSNAGGGDESESGAQKVFDEKLLVINPGQQKPTCLATPMSSRASSFGSSSNCSSSSSSCSSETSTEKPEGKNGEKKQENGTVQLETHERETDVTDQTQ